MKSIRLTLFPLITLLALCSCNKTQSDEAAQKEARQVAIQSVVAFINDNADSLSPKIIGLVKSEGIITSGTPNQQALSTWLKGLKASYLTSYGHGRNMDYFHFNSASLKLGDDVTFNKKPRFNISCLVPIDKDNVVSNQGIVKVQLEMQVPSKTHSNAYSVVKKPLN